MSAPHEHQDSETPNSEITDEAAADSTADLKVVAVVFLTLVIMAVHFVSGWTFDI